MRASDRNVTRLFGMMDGNRFWFYGNYFDFENLGPEFARDEEPVLRGVVGDSVEDGLVA